MKQGIHPEINEVTAHCVCGSTFQTITTSKDLDVDICSQCHPLFTGEQRFVDTAGRIEKFQQRYDKTNKKR
ncbi:50S ribosomal protein L31 [Candidatus Babeliales bacterium]|nr:50S ribosomal protein L31 [Candidatus Babeliales bacterium]MBY0353186.1 50S ribosomal protein L31 [Candidatus Babeliales bacterium]